MNCFEKYKQLDIDKSCLALSEGDIEGGYFCTPIGTTVIGWEGVDGIHYGFIDGFGEMVFAINPIPVAENDNGEPMNVYPLAGDFETFLRLILAGRGATSLEQIIWMSKEQFIDFLGTDYNGENNELYKALDVIRKEFSFEPHENPYDYVKALQKGFDYSKLKFSDEYYDVLGIQR